MALKAVGLLLKAEDRLGTTTDIFDIFDIFDIYRIFSIFSFCSIGGDVN